MKRGTKVAVCQDGKWSRRVEGEVVQTRQGSRIKVRFTYGYDEETTETVEAWFRVRPTVRHQKRQGYFTYGKRKKSYAGWIDTDKWFCPWFTVYKWKEKTNA